MDLVLTFLGLYGAHTYIVILTIIFSINSITYLTNSTLFPFPLFPALLIEIHIVNEVEIIHEYRCVR